MSTEVNGPGDANAGDVVSVNIGNDFRSLLVNASVVKVNKSSLTVALPDGRVLRKPYTSRKTSRVFRRTERRTVVNFRRLDAWDRWEAAKPSSVCGSPTFGSGMVVVSVVVMASAIRDKLDDVLVQMRLLSDWIKAEPPRGAP